MPAEFVNDAAFKVKRFLLGPQRTRRTRLYGVGMPKSGTHSLAAMFFKGVRAGHEAGAMELIDKILDRRAGRISEGEMTAWLRARDRELALEVDSASLNFWILNILLREFPDARFVLTLRDCYSSVNSYLNHLLRFPNADLWWLRMRELRLGPQAGDYEAGEEVLKEKNLHSLDAHFANWTAHNTRVLAEVPAARLLVVRTDEIGQRVFEIADFAGLPRRCVCPQRAHEFRNPAKQEIIRQIDRDLLERKVEQHCRPLMARFFPEIKSLDDAKL